MRAGGDVRPGAAGRAVLKRIEPYADKFKYVRGDISDLQQLLAAASDNKVDRMVNWAMILSKDPMPWLNMKIGLQGMANVFETARILGIKRVVYASSETVYGEQEDYGDREIVEDDRLLPYRRQRVRAVQVLGRGVRGAVRRAVRHQVHGAAALHRLRPRRQGPRVRPLVLQHRVAAGRRQTRRTSSARATGSSRPSSPTRWASSPVWLCTPTSSPHSAYNLGGPPVTLRDFAAAVKKYIPDADITFGDESEDCELPWKVSCERAKEDFGFTLMSIEEAVLKHINEARAEAGMEPLA